LKFNENPPAHLRLSFNEGHVMKWTNQIETCFRFNCFQPTLGIMTKHLCYFSDISAPTPPPPPPHPSRSMWLCPDSEPHHLTPTACPSRGGPVHHLVPGPLRMPRPYWHRRSGTPCLVSSPPGPQTATWSRLRHHNQSIVTHQRLQHCLRYRRRQNAKFQLSPPKPYPRPSLRWKPPPSLWSVLAWITFLRTWTTTQGRHAFQARAHCPCPPQFLNIHSQWRHPSGRNRSEECLAPKRHNCHPTDVNNSCPLAPSNDETAFLWPKPATAGPSPAWSSNQHPLFWTRSSVRDLWWPVRAADPKALNDIPSALPAVILASQAAILASPAARIQKLHRPLCSRSCSVKLRNAASPSRASLRSTTTTTGRRRSRRPSWRHRRWRHRTRHLFTFKTKAKRD